MYLSKLTINVRSGDFRKDYANVHDMHRTVMSAFPEVADGQPARQAHGVLWRLDGTHSGFVQYVQSRTEPDWSRLPGDYLDEAAQVRSLEPVLEGIVGGHRLAFRMVANPTRTIQLPDRDDGKSKTPKRVPHRKPEKQVEWLARKGEQHGFVIPVATNGQPDVAPSPCPPATGRKQPGEGTEQTKGSKREIITIEPVRFDGHLIITDREAFTEAILSGIGRAKAYGCGLLSLAPARKG